MQLVFKMKNFKKVFPKNYWRIESFIEFGEIITELLRNRLLIFLHQLTQFWFYDLPASLVTEDHTF